MPAKMFQGADFVEFDVLLTKDHVPVIYHDFSICLSTARKASSLMYIAVPQKIFLLFTVFHLDIVLAFC